jgi:hypothetical protein
MDTPRKKLKLNKETIRALDLKRVVGGDNDQGSAGCNLTDYVACPLENPWSWTCSIVCPTTWNCDLTWTA